MNPTMTATFPPAPFADAPAVETLPPPRHMPTGGEVVIELLRRSAGDGGVRVVCVNLDRRPERWEAFLRGCPIPGVQRVQAVDGRLARPPVWWRQGGGAWGCMLSHIRILESALQEGMDKRGGVVVVLEDDALFPPDFVERTQRFLRALPKDWEQAYFGGQHRGQRVRKPQRVNDDVVRPFMVNRTQAYAVRGEFIRALYRHLCDWPDHAKHPRHHVDHRMEILHRSGKHKIYAPTEWLIGQAGGKSDISGRNTQDRFWNGRRSSDSEPVSGRKPPVWVIGLHRSGSSVTAGILHRLGVHMGNRLRGYEDRGTGGFEAHGLSLICEAAYPFPSVEAKLDRKIIKSRLRQWIGARQREAAWRGTTMGGKYPHLCFMIDLLLEIEPESRFIHIDRPAEESVRSLTDRSAKARGWLRATPEQCERVQTALAAVKREGLARVPQGLVLNLEYARLLQNPAASVGAMIEFLGLSVREEQRAAAMALVEPQRRKF
jgi:hypothetical protein